ncbi:Hypothetical predicted protein, partial [Pelobates cultripes]
TTLSLPPQLTPALEGPNTPQSSCSPRYTSVQPTEQQGWTVCSDACSGGHSPPGTQNEQSRYRSAVGLPLRERPQDHHDGGSPLGR